MSKVVHGVRPQDAWEFLEAVDFARRVEYGIVVAGWHVALAGGVLVRGSSDKDIDLIFYPHDSTKASLQKLRDVFRKEFEWAQARTSSQMRSWWKKKGSTDTKHVEVWRTRNGAGRRVDVIIPSIVY